MKRNKLSISIQLIIAGVTSVSLAQTKVPVKAEATPAQTATVDMKTYLEQVKKNNPAYQATEQASKGAELRATEGTLLILPQLEIDASKTVDETEPTNASQGNKNTYEKYSVSLLQNTTFGLKGKLSYGNQYTLTENINGTPVGFLGTDYQDGYYRASPSIELTQSLWKNFFGSETRAQREAINAAARATQYAERAKNLGVIIEAQSAYNKLYYAQKTVAAVKESLGAASKLQGWAKRRMDQSLGEKSDYFQTKANYEARELEYLQAQVDERVAARAYNSMKGVNSDTVNEVLSAPTPLAFDKKSFSEKIWRDDVRAASKQAEAARAQSLLGKEKNRPTLDLYGKYAWTGLDPSESDANDEAFKDDHPVYTVGVKFVMPLAFGKSNDVVEGYKQEAMAADLAFKRKAQEQERDYEDLISKIETAQLKNKLATTLEESQRAKVQEERRRHDRGRTTFFQVLQFEQEYLASQRAKINTELELHTLLTQLQQYRGE